MSDLVETDEVEATEEIENYTIYPAIAEPVELEDPGKAGRKLKILAWAGRERDRGLKTTGHDVILRHLAIAEIKRDIGCPVNIQCSDRQDWARTSLHFHHDNDGYDKKWNVASNFTSKPWHEVVDEVVKCDVMCGNCHMYLTHKLRPFLMSSRKNKDGKREPFIIKRMPAEYWRKWMDINRVGVDMKWTGNSMLGIINSQDTVEFRPVEIGGESLVVGDVVWCKVGGYSFCHIIYSITPHKFHNQTTYTVGDVDGVELGPTSTIFGKVYKVNGKELEPIDVKGIIKPEKPDKDAAESSSG